MSVKIIPATEFLTAQYDGIPIIDVRSPSEFKQGHIPGAFNIPLFNDEERAIIGTIYKKVGRDQAISKGLEITGPKMKQLFQTALDKFTSNSNLIVHCWRGGMRSASMAWLLSLTGKTCIIIQGGYKSYRQQILENLNCQRYNFVILGGRTGCQKTSILREMSRQGENVIDLEELADHKGSAFGWIGRTSESGTEQFENDLFCELSKFDINEKIWLENESRTIGKIQIPEGIWKLMREAPLIHLDVDDNWRIENLVNTYYDNNPAQLIESFEKIRKRLGHEQTDEAIKNVQSGNYIEAVAIALNYYDKTYDYGLSRRQEEKVHRLRLQKNSLEAIARLVIEFKNKIIKE
ncbi:MAG: tRNA 2-selenouridine(34) synthase MnmH [Saprospiraceae bacterium]|nr:tRNA 2-selenouridine(34) synthase MnmH [Saprospiraceae bacterium]HMW39279.1 tRNA 2-selenouridine(34) synthase MnmH [Saprospiraceae bacterium]HMX89087.1 tRNA 2-selenouridine(34) synthase MnmH [Saprospiraceae bacterium]HMZ40958.1 tRNA 2-selenouridine(34) synthase MnmH [Saprospiraceae bacterium]HNA65095.1 tRNA 2-selenouridine(34) synthase MnmH [Saprospiraceae bacterium]